MTEPVNEHDLQAYADGALPEERREAVAAWLAAHPDDAERIEGYRRIAEELRTTYEPVLAEPVPDRLRRALQPARMRQAALVAAWIELGAALGAIGGWHLHATQPVVAIALDGATALARRAAVAHATYSPEVRHPVEVGADQEAHLVAWLSKRLGAAVKVPHLGQIGYQLVGGRLLPGEQGPVAQFMFQSDSGQRFTPYVRTGAGDSKETAFRYAQERGISVFYWIDGKFGYALSG